MASARAKAEQAQQAAIKAQSDAEKGRQKAYSYDPNFVQPGAFLLPAYRFLTVLYCFNNLYVYMCVIVYVCLRVPSHCSSSFRRNL